MECIICCEKFNKSGRKIIACPHCLVDTCIHCIKRYLIETYGDPKCMHCKVGWNNDYIRNTFPTSWLSKEYKEHREQLLFDLEKAQMPNTQNYVEATRQRNTIVKLLADMNIAAQEAKKEFNRIILVQQDQTNLLRQMDYFLSGRRAANPLLDHIGGNSLTEDKIEKRHFILSCPVNDCRGFLSTGWKCGVCETNICKDCHIPLLKNDNLSIQDVKKEHVCDPNLKSSVQLLKQDSRPCPQ